MLIYILRRDAHAEVNALKATLTNKELTAKIAELKKTVSPTLCLSFDLVR